MRTVKIILLILLLSACAATKPQYDFADAMAVYERREYAKAVNMFHALAELGEAQAQSFLGAIYSSGEGVRQDYKQAFQWQKKAADQNYAPAQYNLAIQYIKGLGVEQDAEQGIEWMRRAAEHDIAEAKMNLAVMHEHGVGVAACPEGASRWYYQAGQSYLRQGDVRNAKKMLQAIRRIMPDYYLADQLKDEIFMSTPNKPSVPSTVR